MNFKRRKPTREVRCPLCTLHRWLGNSRERRPFRDWRAIGDRRAEAWTRAIREDDSD